jgi:hypothetical protein
MVVGLFVGSIAHRRYHCSAICGALLRSIAREPINDLARLVLDDNRRAWILRPELCPECIYYVTRSRELDRYYYGRSRCDCDRRRDQLLAAARGAVKPRV